MENIKLKVRDRIEWAHDFGYLSFGSYGYTTLSDMADWKAFDMENIRAVVERLVKEIMDVQEE